MSVLVRFRSPILAAALASGVLAGGCGDDAPSAPAGPVAGTAVLSIDGVSADDRAVLVRVGAGASSVEPADPALQVHVRSDGEGGWRIVAIGALAGPLARLSLPDTSAVPNVVIQEVAVDDGALRSGLAGYRARTEVER